MEKSLIAAVADNGAIGRNNQLLWHLPGDMRYFKETTLGAAVIMGWMTYQSIGRPLPGRRNLVISLFPWPDAPREVTVVDSLQAAYASAEAQGAARAFVIGGAYTYAEALPLSDTLYLTHVHDAPADADVFFPPLDPDVWHAEARSGLHTDPATGITYEFVRYGRNR